MLNSTNSITFIFDAHVCQISVGIASQWEASFSCSNHVNVLSRYIMGYPITPQCKAEAAAAFRSSGGKNLARRQNFDNN